MITPNEFIDFIQSIALDPQRIPIAITAIIICNIVGLIIPPLSARAIPAFWMVIDAMFGVFGARMDKPERLRGDLIFRGTLFILFIIFIAFLSAQYVQLIIDIYP